MKIMLASEVDAGALTAMYMQLSKNYEPNSGAVRAAILDSPKTEVFKAVEGERIVGTVTISYRSVPSIGLVAYVDDLVVRKDCRRKGFARKLMEHAESRARTKGCRAIELTSRPDRKEATALYMSLGYETRWTNPFLLRLD
jgi:ribosomal protein S18 acetylase RimI-like enzyme